MLNYEDRIKELSEIRFCGQCFKGFIRRYEMNIHPAPLEVEEKPPPQYVFPPLSALTSLVIFFSSQPMEMRRVDVDEESYFNGDDDEDEDDGVTPGPHPAPTSPLPTLISPPLSRFFGQKRRRQRAPGVPLRTGLAGITQRAPTPATPIHLPRTPPISALVEYGEDDEQSSDPEDALLESLVSKPPASAMAAAGSAISSTSTSTLSSPISPTTTAAAGAGGGGFVPLRPEKRRRAEEDEDEMGLERLVAGKSKRPAKTGTTGAGEEGPKRIRLRVGAAGLAAASSTPPTAARSGSGAKDGDTG